MNKLALLVLCVWVVGCGGDDTGEAALVEERVGDAGVLEQTPDAASNALTGDDAAAAQHVAPDAGTGSSDAAADSSTHADAAAELRVVSHEDAIALIDAKCGSCHQPMDVNSPTAGAWPVLKDLRVQGFAFPAPGDHAHCAGWDYIVPGHPEQSLLYVELTANAPCGAHPVMPSPPSAAQVETIGDAMRTWGADGGA